MLKRVFFQFLHQIGRAMINSCIAGFLLSGCVADYCANGVASASSTHCTARIGYQLGAIAVVVQLYHQRIELQPDITQAQFAHRRAHITICSASISDQVNPTLPHQSGETDGNRPSADARGGNRATVIQNAAAHCTRLCVQCGAHAGSRAFRAKRE